MNLTLKGLEESSRKLDDLREMAVSLIGSPSSKAPSDPSAAGLVESLKSGFEDAMNDNLNIKTAFDSVHATVDRLMALKRDGRINVSDTAQAEKVLLRVDQVLQVIF